MSSASHEHGDYTDTALAVALVNSNLSTTERQWALQAINERAELRRKLSATAAPAVVSDEMAAFKDAFSRLDLLMTKDAWGRDVFYHAHVQSLWQGWKTRAALVAAVGGGE